MGAPESTQSVDSKLSSALERLERLMGEGGDLDIDHPQPETVEDAVRRLKGKLPEQQDY